MSYTKFESRHKSALNTILRDESLYNMTSDRQEKNGTIAIWDAVTDVTYTLHTTGYIRHNDGKGWPQFWGGGIKRSWQLNRQAKIEDHWGRLTSRIMANADEQIVILINAITRDRKVQRVKDLELKLAEAIADSRKR